jgi:hypothetical protein
MLVFVPNNKPYLQDVEFNKFNVTPIIYTYTYPYGNITHGIVFVIELNSLNDLIEFERLNKEKNVGLRYSGIIINYDGDNIQSYLDSKRITLENRELVEKCVFSIFIYDEYIE